MPRLRRLVWLIVLALAACRQPEVPLNNPNLQIDLAYEPREARVGPAELLVTVRRADGTPIAEAVLDIRGDMAHAGMVPVLRQALTDGQGQARVPFEWTMGGSWFVEVIVTAPDGEKGRGFFELNVAS
ncbi:MAG: FixH family protein [Anaerolineae bacterium]|nr:FixH family protein [Anaerolineae bacterium]MDW8171218.1 FixH family protein [Anaerolineae bacterium]